MRLSSSGFAPQAHDGENRCLNSELWHACAGPLVSLPTVGSRVVYFPQGHSEQVAATTNREVDAHIPNYSSLPPQLICQLHNVTMHADGETDEVYAQMTLQPLNTQEEKDAYIAPELCMRSKQPTNYFCKTLTASDTSTHGGFSVPRRAAEKVFPPLDFSLQPPAQELIARDLHNNEWKFRHIFRGQPKRHLLTTGWSVFVSAKRLVAGDSVLFIWNEKNQLLLGIRRANRPQAVMPSSVLSSDSMHLGLLAAAAHAAATNSRFTIFYNPRASRAEFVIPLAKYVKAVYHTRVSVGMRFRMMFETEESSVRRYMGTITGISDLDPVRWPNSYWRSVKVGWDESTAGERQPHVSLWEIEPLASFPMYPSPFPLRLKRPWPPGLYPDDEFAFCPPFPCFQPFNLATSPWIGLNPMAPVQHSRPDPCFLSDEDLQLLHQPQPPAMAPFPEPLDNLLDLHQTGNWFSAADPQNRLLFGVNLDASSSSLPDSSALPYPSPNFIDESGFPPSTLPNRAFVKVYKTGSFGRSLDITKYSSYQELRGELGRMFGLEGMLEDPLRSGWQLVFVDRENDVLLLGDDPWPEFVNSVSCIKVLSPEEVEQMGQTGLQMLNGGASDDPANLPDCRNFASGLTSVDSLDY